MGENVRLDVPLESKTSGWNSLATNAKNTLQHAESWEEPDVVGTMDLIGKSEGSEHLSQPNVIVGPGGEFTVNMTSDDQSSYTLPAPPSCHLTALVWC